MIFGIGIDTIEVSRIANSIATYGDQFVKRIFSEEEIRYCTRKPHAAQHFAGRFAAKEAFAKSLGTGIRRGFVWRNVSVAREYSGRPYIRLLGNMPHLATSIVGENYTVQLSITHTRLVAEAIVTIESVG